MNPAQESEPPQRVEHRVGSGTSRAGESWTIIRRGRNVVVDKVDESGEQRRFRATLRDGVFAQLIEALRAAGFPEPPKERVTAATTRVVSVIRDGRELRTPPMGQTTEDPRWGNVFSLLDGIALQTTAPGTAKDGALVSDAAEVPLFKPAEQMEEPPLGEDASDLVTLAWELAAQRKHVEVTPVHLLAALAKSHGYQLTRLGLDADSILDAAEALFPWDPADAEPAATSAFGSVVDVARLIAAEDGAHEATLRHVVRALLQSGGSDVASVLQKHRLPDAMLGGRTRERIFAMPAPTVDRHCRRCGAEGGDLRWCAACGQALITPAAFETGSVLDRIVPRIEPHHWPDRERAAHRSLCDLPDQAGTPWLSFHVSADDGDELVTHARLVELGISLQRLEQNAIANLAKSAGSWTPRWVSGPDARDVDVLFCTDEPLAAERLLDRPFLLHAQTMLGANALAATVPQRRLLLVTRLEHLAVLMALARKYFEEAADERLSPWGFALQDGRISGPISA